MYALAADQATKAAGPHAGCPGAEDYARRAVALLRQAVRKGWKDLAQLKKDAQARVARLHRQGVTKARLYGADDKVLGGLNSFYLLLDEPEVYGLPPDPVVTTRDLPSMYRHVGAAALTLVGAVVGAFLSGRRR